MARHKKTTACPIKYANRVLTCAFLLTSVEVVRTSPS